MNSDVTLPNALDKYFATFAERATEADRLSRALQKALSRLQKALLIGDVTAIAKGLSDVGTAQTTVQKATLALLTMDVKGVEAHFQSESYFREIADLAQAHSIAGVRSTEGRLFAYPYVIERKKATTALSIGRRTTRDIRPTAVINTIVAARKRATQIDQVAILSAVEKIYDLLARGTESKFVGIDQIYETLTTMPGSEKDLPFPEFLVALDSMRRSNQTTTKGGRLLDFPAPSTSGKGGKAFRVIREDGREQLYHMVRFVDRPPADGLFK